ncbi:biopolymer transporter ExbD [Tenacibaculum finnmarkense genomovar finnmarkense]|uniref:Biopolymer transporter ExbD n=2 Tax=Tenacibaculum finnmarkense TaxID=2781243 RepID=A0A2I2M8R1_9FLAO|nr:biopolymer transporter ExbD [Tenacibaculum finnmarkense]ALU74171.1 biopolymer transporter ExbD [Tenacibaculum dicentrarchi]MBE7634744.1 biopolymer transporter ExbD [Tenacibaculum finnmarkense genomovar ulcerans]MBE7646463.1 biopolymer transporter ExbD [Tenacibaculum finnmarkense genomovar ulcerans]MBE7648444.1 biopolymer transporter ExbD [Tenacibaculum finnmarkense genomovar ulcerans]MBE7652755.1 biopolymer transporter ExbD [Tenacibaculum finnmarkense genomovar finnmarkense]
MNLKGRNKVDPSFNMSSMTDIVFLLLIFFMLTSTLVTVNAIDVLLPKAGGKTENNSAIAVSITEDSAFYIDKTKVSAVNLEKTILSKVGTDKKKTVVIRGDQNVAYKNVMKVIDIANRNKLKMILAVKAK